MNRLKIIPTVGTQAREPLDMFEQQNISFNYQLSDIRDVFKQGSDYSKTIKIPSTSRNDEFFNYNFEVTVSNISANGDIKFNPIKKVNCYVNIDSETVFDGNLQLLNINVVNGLIEYEVMLRGNSINFSALWKNVKLQDYIGEYYDKYNHNRSKGHVYENIEGSRIYENGVNTAIGFNPSKGYAYYVDGRKRDNLEISKLAEMTPALFVTEMLENIFKKAGYELILDFGEEIYDIYQLVMLGGRKPTLSQLELNRTISNPELVVGSNNKQIIYNGIGNNFTEIGPINPVEFQTVSSEDNVFVGDIQFRDDLNQWDESISRFVAAESSTYDIKINIPLNPVFTYSLNTNVTPRLLTTSNFYIKYEIKLLRNDGSTKLLRTQTMQPLLPQIPFQTNRRLDLSLTDYYDAYFINESITEEFIEAGEEIRLDIFHIFDGNPSDFLRGTRPTFDAVGVGSYNMTLEVPKFIDGVVDGVATRDVSQFEVKRSSSVLNGTNDFIDVKTVLPDMKVYDFFNNFKKMYNLLIIPDELNKTVLLTPRELYFSDRYKIIDDWEIDEDSEIKIQPMSEVDFKQYELTYSKDSDYLNNVSDETDLLGSKILQIDNDFSNKTNKLKVSFSLPNTTSAIPDNALIKFNEDGTFENVDKVKPRIAYFYNYVDVAITLDDSNSRLGFEIGDTSIVPKYIEDYEPPEPEFSRFYPLRESRLVGSWRHSAFRRPAGTLEFTTLNEARAYNDTNLPALVEAYDKTFAARYNYTNPSMGLFNKYYAKTFSDLTDVDSKLMTAYVKLTPSQIKLFDFRDVIRLKGVFWRVNKIMNYDPLNGDKLTKVEFIRVFDIESAQNFIPKDSDTLDTGDWTVRGRFFRRYYVKGNDINPTQAECNGVNGNYDSSTGRCYLPFTWPPFNPGPFGRSQSTGLGPAADNIPFTTNGNQSQTFEPATKKPMVNHSAFNTVLGKGNRLSNTNSNMLVVGNDNYADGDVGGSVIVVGDNIEVLDKDPTIYVGNIKINEDGQIINTKQYVIDSGEDISFNYDKTNLIDIIDGTIDSVRNSGGDSKLRPIISNNPNDVIF